MQPPLAVHPVPPQSIDVGHRDLRQPLIFTLLVLVIFPLQDLARGRAAEGFVCFIDGRQPLDIGRRVLAGKAMPPIAGRYQLTPLPILADQSGDLRPAQSRHLGQILPQQSFGGSVLPAVALPAQRLRHPGVDLGTPFALESYFIAGLQKLPYLLQAQRLAVLHVDGQSPACSLPHPSGSSCVRN